MSEPASPTWPAPTLIRRPQISGPHLVCARPQAPGEDRHSTHHRGARHWRRPGMPWLPPRSRSGNDSSAGAAVRRVRSRFDVSPRSQFGRCATGSKAIHNFHASSATVDDLMFDDSLSYINQQTPPWVETCGRWHHSRLCKVTLRLAVGIAGPLPHDSICHSSPRQQEPATPSRQ